MSNGWKAWGVAALLAVTFLGATTWWALRRHDQTDDGQGPPPPGPTADDSPWFRDVTAESGVSFTYRNGQEANQYAILESIGGGVGLIDYDGDGLLDLFLPGGGHFEGPDNKQLRGYPCRLFKNLGGWKFKDVTAEVGLDKIPFYTHGCAVADYDCDGRPDLLVTGYGRLALFRNTRDAQGRPRFVEVTKEVNLLGPPFWSTSAGWADLNGDGYPELYVCQYVDWSPDNNPVCEGYQASIPRDVCPPRQFEALPHALYLNNGGRNFTNVTRDAGLHTSRMPRDYGQLTYLSDKAMGRLREADHERDFGKGLGVVLADVNGDGLPEIYVANDTTDKFLYLNRSGGGKLRFEDQAIDLGVARDERGARNGSMGLDVGDYDGSGRPSFLVTNYQNEVHALYRNVSSGGRLHFQYNSRVVGLGRLGRSFVGFGTGFLDVDRDGWLDIVIANGHVIRYPSGSQVRQRPVLLRNEGLKATGKDVHFADMAARAGEYFNALHQGRGLAIGDLDNDGRPDLVISHVNAPVTLLRNEAAPGHHWLGIELAHKEHRDLVGARLTLDVGGRRLTSFAKGGGSFLSSGDRRHLFGLGNADRVGRLTVAWPGGKVEFWDGLAVDRYWRVTAGVKEAQELPGQATSVPPGR